MLGIKVTIVRYVSDEPSPELSSANSKVLTVVNGRSWKKPR
jgi:hypothetical protein